MESLDSLTTEGRNERTTDLDVMSPLEFAHVMCDEGVRAAACVEEVLSDVAVAIEWAADAIAAGGRLVYMGAGTSGRLGVLDASECPPTFGVSPDAVVGLIAGGRPALTDAAEGAEDDARAGAEDLRGIGLAGGDMVVGIAASGRTPYVIGGLRYARSLGARTVALACNRGSAIGAEADLAIEPVPGPEVLSGSTRLKAGTVQKLVLNMISTGCMVRLGKVYQNLMVDVRPTNEKLVARASRIVREATGCTPDEAERALAECSGAKAAIVSLLAGCGADEAERRLRGAGGSVRRAVAGARG